MDENDSAANAVEMMFTLKDCNGVGVVSASDGTFFCFAENTLAALLEKARANEKKTCIVFVKHGGGAKA